MNHSCHEAWVSSSYRAKSSVKIHQDLWYDEGGILSLITTFLDWMGKPHEMHGFFWEKNPHRVFYSNIAKKLIEENLEINKNLQLRSHKLGMIRRERYPWRTLQSWCRIGDTRLGNGEGPWLWVSQGATSKRRPPCDTLQPPFALRGEF